ncbi:MAG: hypothetical protein KF864_13480 [Phycisphaeraceae bacterium]|nr:hypothetical protein [Phycisphaeraceae bacterium]
MSTSATPDPRKPSMKPVYVGAIIVGGAWLTMLGITLVVFVNACESTVARWGQFGDAFGTVNALFSGLALLGVVYAILLQREDIEIQRVDLKASVEAQKEAAVAQASQARIAALSAALAAKKETAESLEEAARHGSGVTKIKDREIGLADIAASIRKEMLEIHALVDAELKKAVQEYKPEGKA